MKRTLTLMMVILLLMNRCGGTKVDNTYHQITQESAPNMMDTQNVIILDIREQDEFDARHICSSGNRSKTASSALAELGCTHIYEFGGIKTWPYEVEK